MATYTTVCGISVVRYSYQPRVNISLQQPQATIYILVQSFHEAYNYTYNCFLALLIASCNKHLLCLRHTRHLNALTLYTATITNSHSGSTTTGPKYDVIVIG